jgi:peroxiredoxin Q/BCP
MLKIDSLAPDFKLLDQDGREHRLSQYRGQFVLVYFYPKDDTPGCIKEANALRDSKAEFATDGIKVLGISADSVASHKKFAAKYGLPFTLLSDPEKKIISQYGALPELDGKRISYLLDKAGRVIKTYPKVDPAFHAEQILADFKTLKLETD